VKNKNKSNKLLEFKQRRKTLLDNLVKYQGDKDHFIAAMHLIDSFDGSVLKDGSLTEAQRDEILRT
tara:strand:- start:642 stop:839 length:198 start_codon:yes stop_codon:yes gene_type:complete